jgi:hypothetical protein
LFISGAARRGWIGIVGRLLGREVGLRELPL